MALLSLSSESDPELSTGTWCCCWRCCCARASLLCAPGWFMIRIVVCWCCCACCCCNAWLCIWPKDLTGRRRTVRISAGEALRSRRTGESVVLEEPSDSFSALFLFFFCFFFNPAATCAAETFGGMKFGFKKLTDLPGGGWDCLEPPIC